MKHVIIKKYNNRKLYAMFPNKEEPNGYINTQDVLDFVHDGYDLSFEDHYKHKTDLEGLLLSCMQERERNVSEPNLSVRSMNNIIRAGGPTEYIRKLHASRRQTL